MKVHLLILSGGIGSRYKSNIPKQYTTFNDGTPIIKMSVKPFLKSTTKMESLTFVCDRKWIAFIKDIVQDIRCPIFFANSGETRELSIFNGIQKINKSFSVNQDDFVLLQEAVRPFVDVDLINRLIQEPKKYPCVSPAINPAVLYGDFNFLKKEVNSLIKKTNIVELMMPKRYNLQLMTEYFLEKNNFNRTLIDETQLFIEKNHKIKCIPGDFKNIKITYPLHRFIMDGINKNK